MFIQLNIPKVGQRIYLHFSLFIMSVKILMDLKVLRLIDMFNDIIGWKMKHRDKVLPFL